MIIFWNDLTITGGECIFDVKSTELNTEKRSKIRYF